MFDKSVEYFTLKRDACIGDVKAMEKIAYAKKCLLKYSKNKNDIQKIIAVYKYMLEDNPKIWFNEITKNTIMRLNKFCKDIVYSMSDNYIEDIVYEYLSGLPQFEKYYFACNFDMKLSGLINILKGKGEKDAK